MNTNYKPTAAQRALQKIIKEKTSILAYGGSRSGKTFELCRAIAVLAARYGGRYGIFRRYFNAVKNSVFNDTFPKMMSVCFPEMRWERKLSDTYVQFCNGAEIWFIGLDDQQRVDKILGREFAAIYFNECSEIPYQSVETALTRLSQQVYDKDGHRLRNRAFYDCNPPSKSHWAHKIFVEHQNPVSRSPLTDADQYGCIRMNPTDNAENLPPQYIESTLAGRSERFRKRFLYGEWSDDNENALWKSTTMIDPFRVDSVPDDLEKIVVGVDPAVTANQTSDLTGIVVCGTKRAADGQLHYYVFDDQSGVYTPKEWTTIVNHLYVKWNANYVIVEVNQGGQLVTEAMRNANYILPIKSVRASNGKITRAEPVAVLYERGLAHHVGEWPDLEEELTSYTGRIGEKSPDRMDALVWAMMELAEQQHTELGTVSFF